VKLRKVRASSLDGPFDRQKRTTHGAKSVHAVSSWRFS